MMLYFWIRKCIIVLIFEIYFEIYFDDNCLVVFNENVDKYKYISVNIGVL